MSTPLHERMSQQMRAGPNGNGGVSQADWIWVMARLTPDQMTQIEAQAAEHECSMLHVLRDWPELFAPVENDPQN